MTTTPTTTTTRPHTTTPTATAVPRVASAAPRVWTTLLALLLGVTMVAGVGCKYAPGDTQPDPLSELDYPKVAALETLRGKLKLAEVPVVNRSDAGPMTVTAAVRLASDKEVNGQYRFFFMDATGQPLDEDPPWQFRVLPARAKVYLTGTSLDADATDWRLEVRPARQPGRKS